MLDPSKYIGKLLEVLEKIKEVTGSSTLQWKLANDAINEHREIQSLLPDNPNQTVVVIASNHFHFSTFITHLKVVFITGSNINYHFLGSKNRGWLRGRNADSVKLIVLDGWYNNYTSVERQEFYRSIDDAKLRGIKVVYFNDKKLYEKN